MKRQNRTSLKQDTAWAMTGALAQTASQAAVMVVLAQVASSQTVGQYALGLAIATPLNVFADRAVRMLQATAGEDDFPLAEYVALRGIVGVGALVVTLVILGVGQFGSSAGRIVLLVALGRFVEGIAQTLYGRLHRDFRMPQIGQSQVLRGLSTTVVSVTCLLVWRRLDLVLGASLLVNVAIVMLLDRRRVAQISVDNDVHNVRVPIGSAWREMVILGLPLAISTFLVSLSINLPRLVLSAWVSESTLGVFAVLCYACFPATMLVSAIMQAATPRLAEHFREDPTGKFQHLIRRLFMTCGAVGVSNWVLMHVFGRSLLDWSFGAEYSAAASHLNWIAAATGMGYLATVPATAMNAQRLFRMSLLTCGFSCAVASLSAFLLIPRLGMTGAAATMILTSSTHLLVSYAALRYAATPWSEMTSNLPRIPFRRRAA